MTPQPHPALVGGPIYLDYNATTPVDPRVTETALAYLTNHFGNPSSDHAYGDAPRSALTTARSHVAALVGARPHEVAFTGSGSEANLLAIRGTVLTASTSRPHVIVQATEHPSVLETVDALSRHHGVRVTVLPVDRDGRVDPDALGSAMSRDTVLVSIMAANNETGAIQPVAVLADVAHRHGALFHCDAAQAAGKIPLSVDELGVDLLTLVGHKMYAPKGIGALYAREGLDLEPVVYGGGQERGLRAGTENVTSAVAMGAAAQLAATDLTESAPNRVRTLRDALHEKLDRALPGRIHLNGPVHDRLPNTLNISVSGMVGNELLAGVPQIAASTGSACHSGRHTPSPALTAMGFDADRALAAVRLSLGRWSSPEDVDATATALAEAVVR